MQTQTRNTTVLASASKTTTKQRVRYANSGRNRLTDPAPPVNDGAKVKLDLYARNNDNLLAFATAHNQDMTGNAYFPAPLPAAPDYEAVLAAYSKSITDWMSARSAANAASSAMAAARVAMEEALNTRGGYVQIASNSNTEAIQSSGFGIRAPRTPATPLPQPTGLTVDLNGVTGLMMLSWDADPYAKGYVVQYSENVTPRVWKVQPRVSKAKLSFAGMTVGKTFVFQVASLGGSTGQSPWSPEVSRAAA
jgi:hypothetical protein